MSDSRNNPYNKKQGGKNAPNKNTNVNANTEIKADARFREAQLRLQESVQKHLNQEYESSEEEEELESDDILGSVVKRYSQFGGDIADLGRTQNFLENAFHSGAAVCLICIGSVKRVESIWSCESCYGFFHLICIQRWAKDSIAQQKLALEEQQDKKSITIAWQCPKCRKDYQPSKIPSRYECFCGKVLDPSCHPWLVPHSCGDACGLPLKPKCGHFCLLLCHPGPCPPCPKMVKVPCYCGASGNQPVRCSQKERSCGKTCAKELPCKKHKCPGPCHVPPCQPCLFESSVTCNCGSEEKLIPCAQLSWQCDKVCGKSLGCGNHNCEIVCHKGDCGPCPKTLPRSCPCGKETANLPCTEEVSTCGGTCNKMLDCGRHSCSQRCHRGSCGMCVERIVKQCRCGFHSKEVSCHKEYLCDTKCKRLRDCRIHPCNRKCCNGLCPPCEKTCGKTLGCGQHKCGSVCHRGACYPCYLTQQVSCRCGSTVITVPCGIAKRKYPPKCSKKCSIPPDCHHPEREPHRCHFGACPPCKQTCRKPRGCGHPCTEPCHTAVLVSIEPNYKPATPWEKAAAAVEVRELECPPCPELVLVECLGGHEESPLPCYRAVSHPCGRLCGRSLPCANHTCVLPCHVVTGALDSQSAGENCEQCTAECTAPRMEGCTHSCSKPCHPPPCPYCPLTLRLRCHCSLNQCFIKCQDWITATPEKKEEILCCGNQCPKKYACGHRCASSCHSGECPGADHCKRKVKVTCPCKRIKKEFQCHISKSDLQLVTCDDVCETIKQRKKEEEEKDKEQSRREEEQRNREELEQFKKKLQGRKRNRKRQITDSEDKQDFISRYKFVMLTVAVTLAASVTYLLTK